MIGPTHIFKTVIYQCFDSSHQLCAICTDIPYAIICLQQSQNTYHSCYAVYTFPKLSVTGFTFSSVIDVKY